MVGLNEMDSSRLYLQNEGNPFLTSRENVRDNPQVKRTYGGLSKLNNLNDWISAIRGFWQ